MSRHYAQRNSNVAKNRNNFKIIRVLRRALMLSMDDRAAVRSIRSYDTEFCARLKAFGLVLTHYPSFQLCEFSNYVIQR